MKLKEGQVNLKGIKVSVNDEEKYYSKETKRII
jgi:hypothetical protein